MNAEIQILNKESTSTVTNSKKFYIESYGCQMNFADSEVVASIVSKEGYDSTKNLNDADLILLNTCSIRDKAEQTVRKRLVKSVFSKRCLRLYQRIDYVQSLDNLQNKKPYSNCNSI